jgi:hypothetical protein
MAINVNVGVANTVPRINEDSLTLIIFKNARYAAGKSGVIRVNSLQDLYDNFTLTTLDEGVNDATVLKEARELYSAEYLLRAGVNLLCYAVTSVGTIAAGDITAIEDVEVLNYKLIAVPYDFIDATNTESLLLNHVKSNDIQLYMDLEPFTLASEVETIKTAIGTAASAKLELFINAGLPTFSSAYDLIPSDFNVESTKVDPDGTPGNGDEYIDWDLAEYAEATDFVGIPASLAALVRKVKLLNAGTPWLPVAGETYGMVNEFVKVLRTLSTSEKTAFQAENINVLVTKVGVGNLFVSQNTLHITEDASNPLIRSHVVTEALWVKRILKALAYSLEYAPNNSKTWNIFDTKATRLFKNMLASEGIEDYHVEVGLGITMTEEDIQNGLFKAFVSFLPVRVIEDIAFNVVIQVEEDSYDVTLVGGDL